MEDTMLKNDIIRPGFAVIALTAVLCMFYGAPHAARATAVFDGDSEISSLQAQALRITSRDGQYILNMAWPLAFGMLQYQSADLLSSRKTNSGYAVTTRINYLNLLGRPHFLKLTFSYDRPGDLVGLQLTGHSDIIAPQINPSRLMELISFSGSPHLVAEAYTVACGP
jgi:hypothetical protein